MRRLFHAKKMGKMAVLVQSDARVKRMSLSSLKPIQFFYPCSNILAGLKEASRKSRNFQAKSLMIASSLSKALSLKIFAVHASSFCSSGFA
jgi:hypothetical protein